MKTIGFAALAILALWGWSIAQQRPLPGDIWFTGQVQALFGVRPGWAALLTKTATEPQLWLLAGVAAGGAALFAGWRSSIVVLLSFAATMTIDRGLRALIHVPRPSPDLVLVAKPAASSGLPSSFGLLYGATIGLLMMLAWGRRDPGARLILWGGAALLIAGLLARVTMGGHWASQMLASYAAAMLAGAGIARLAGRR